MKTTMLTVAELETIKAAAEERKDWPLVWMCDGALAGDLGCNATVRVRTKR
jgi:hypothetical protein